MSVHLSSFSQQLSFNKSKKNKEMYFNYTWSDHQEKTSDISFSLPFRQLNKQNHKKFIPNLAQQYVYIEMRKAAKKIDPEEARVHIQRRGQDIHIQVTSRSNKLLDKWQRSMNQGQQKALDQYLQDNYYNHFRSYLGQKAIKPDHLRYV